MGLDWDKVSEEERTQPLHEPTPFPCLGSEQGRRFKLFMDAHYTRMHNLSV